MTTIHNPKTGTDYPVVYRARKVSDGTCDATACHLNGGDYRCKARNYIPGFRPERCGMILLDCVSDDGEHIALPIEVVEEWEVDE